MIKCMFYRAFKGLASEMVVSKCRLESALFHLVFLLQLLTSMMEDLLQVFIFYTFTDTDLFNDIWNNLCLLIIFPHSSSWDTPAHGRTVSVSTLPVCCPGDYVLAADCIKAWKSRFTPMWFCLQTCFGSFFFFLSSKLRWVYPSIKTSQGEPHLVALCFNCQTQLLHVLAMWHSRIYP